MLFHALPTRPTKNPRAVLNWWAVHAETLTPIRIHSGSGGRIALDIVIDSAAPTVVFASHPDAVADPAAIAAGIMEDLSAHICPGCILHSSKIIPPGQADLPEHLIVFDAQGEHPHLWRTADPHMIVPVEHQDICFKTEAILGQPTYFRTATDLPATGWEYWWTECQLAMRELAPAIEAILDKAPAKTKQ